MLKKRKTPLNALFAEREGIRVYPISNKSQSTSTINNKNNESNSTQSRK